MVQAVPDRPERRPVEILTDEDVQGLLGGCSRSATGRRDRATVVLMYRAGLRVSEVCGLAVRDIDVESCTIRVRRGKGDKDRTVGIDKVAMECVKEWMKVREKVLGKLVEAGKLSGDHGQDALLCTLKGKEKGKRLFPRHVQQMLEMLADRAEIFDKRVHPHGLRHTMAAQMALEGIPMPIIQRQLGHANLQTTSVYLQGIMPADVVDAMVVRSWQTKGVMREQARLAMEAADKEKEEKERLKERLKERVEKKEKKLRGAGRKGSKKTMEDPTELMWSMYEGVKGGEVLGQEGEVIVVDGGEGVKGVDGSEVIVGSDQPDPSDPNDPNDSSKWLSWPGE
jgi:integrase/recombinase XerD